MPTFLELIYKQNLKTKDLERCTEINKTDESGHTALALHLQQANPSPQIVSFLLKKDAALFEVKLSGSPSQKTQLKQYPLFISLVKNSCFQDVFTKAVERKSSFDSKDGNIFQWLFLTPDSNSSDRVEDPKFDSTKLKDKIELFKKIITLYNSKTKPVDKKQSNFLGLIEKKDDHEESPLDLACKFGYKDLLEEFISKLSTHKGSTPAQEVINLIENAPSSGKTLLHLACSQALNGKKTGQNLGSDSQKSANIEDLETLDYLLDIILKNYSAKAPSLFKIKDKNGKTFIDYAFENKDVDVIDLIHRKTYNVTHSSDVCEWIYNTRGADDLLEYMEKRDIGALSINLRSKIIDDCEKAPEIIAKFYEKKLLHTDNYDRGENFFDILIKKYISNSDTLEAILKVLLEKIKEKDDKDLLDKLTQSFINLAIQNKDVGKFFSQIELEILKESYEIAVKKIDADKKGNKLINAIEKKDDESARELIEDPKTNVNLRMGVAFPLRKIILNKNQKLFDLIVKREDLFLNEPENTITSTQAAICVNFYHAVEYFAKNRPLETLRDLAQNQVFDEDMLELAKKYNKILLGAFPSDRDVDEFFYEKKLSSLKFILDNLPQDFDICAALFSHSDSNTKESFLSYCCKEFKMVGIGMVEEILKRYPKIIDRKNDQDESPLYVAAVRENRDLVALLIKYGANSDDIMPLQDSTKCAAISETYKVDEIIKKVKKMEEEKLHPSSSPQVVAHERGERKGRG